MYPYGRFPRECTFIQTSLLRYTPSNSTNTSFPLEVTGTVNVFRYHPKPPGNAPPPVPDGAFSLNSPSMLQSCGRSSCRHCASFNPVSCPFGTSPRLKRQSWLDETVFPGREFARHSEPPNSSTQNVSMILFIVLSAFFRANSWLLQTKRFRQLRVLLRLPVRLIHCRKPARIVPHGPTN